MGRDFSVVRTRADMALEQKGAVNLRPQGGSMDQVYNYRTVAPRRIFLEIILGLNHSPFSPEHEDISSFPN